MSFFRFFRHALKNTKECPTCHGSGRVPIIRCPECGLVCDDDGYCDFCATQATEKYAKEHPEGFELDCQPFLDLLKEHKK